MEEILLKLMEIEENLDINNLPENINILQIKKIPLDKGDYNYKKYDYSFHAFLSIELDNKKYIICPDGYGNNGKNDDIITGGDGAYEFKKNFNSIYDLQEIL